MPGGRPDLYPLDERSASDRRAGQYKLRILPGKGTEAFAGDYGWLYLCHRAAAGWQIAGELQHFKEVDFMHQRAEVGIFIGDEEDRGKGYGTAALGLLIGYAFDTLHLHSLMLRVFDYNERAIRC